MKLLLDTHIFIAVLTDTTNRLPDKIKNALSKDAPELHVSAATLWEMSIKWRLGKLEFGMPLGNLPQAAKLGNIGILAINERHAITHVTPEPLTRDPFDRLLLAQCAVENMRLVTIDSALQDHPLSATAS
jgi:PIN domain nuclease of toxin-antitoxin system